jgi:hypothetical protein
MGFFRRYRSSLKKSQADTPPVVPRTQTFDHFARSTSSVFKGRVMASTVVSATGPPVDEHPTLPDLDGPLPSPPDPNLDAPGYLRSIQAVRERTSVIYEKAKANDLKHFHVDWEKLPQTVKWVEGIIKVSALTPSFD